MIDLILLPFKLAFGAVFFVVILCIWAGFMVWIIGSLKRGAKSFLTTLVSEVSNEVKRQHP